MVENSTLFYLVDDLNLPSDMILTPYEDNLLKDEYYSCFLDLLEVDPGEQLVRGIMEKLEEQ